MKVPSTGSRRPERMRSRHESRNAIATIRRIWLAVSILLVVASTVASGGQSRARRFQALLDLRAADVDGRVWTHDRLQGRITLLDFWATWCAPCLRELPFMQRARARYGERFEVIGISLDTRDRPSLRAWIENRRISWPQIHAEGGFGDPIAVAFAIDRLPTNLLLDREGRIRAIDVRGEQLFVEIDRLLAEKSR